MERIAKLKPKRHRIPTELMIDAKIFCYLERMNKVKFKDIAWHLKRDHSTVMYHLSDIEFLLKKYRNVQEALESFNREEFLRKLNRMNIEGEERCLKCRVSFNPELIEKFFKSQKLRGDKFWVGLGFNDIKKYVKENYASSIKIPVTKNNQLTHYCCANCQEKIYTHRLP